MTFPIVHAPLAPGDMVKDGVVARSVHLFVSMLRRRNVAVTETETIFPVTVADALSATQFWSDPVTLPTVAVVGAAVVVVGR